MDKFEITSFKQYSELPMSEFEKLNYSVVVFDKGWNYVYVNDFVKRNFGGNGKNLIGKNLWVRFPQLTGNSAYTFIKNETEQGVPTNTFVTSPVSALRLNIRTYPLNDCYLLFSSVMPNKNELLNDLRDSLAKRKTST